MKKTVVSLALACILVCTSVTAFATQYVFQAPQKGLPNLDYKKAYQWGINLKLAPDEQITGATLTFSSVYDKKKEKYPLYVDLLNNQPGKPFPALKTFKDGKSITDYFDVWTFGETHLLTYIDLPKKKQNLAYAFTAGQLANMRSYLSDGCFALAIDSDVRNMKNGRIYLTVRTAIVPPNPPAPPDPPILPPVYGTITPEPGSMILIAGGSVFMGLAYLRRRLSR